MSDDFPTIRAELERKTIEEVQRLCHDLNTMRISPAQFRSSMRTLWNCSSGLVNRETMDIITEIAKQGEGMQCDIGVFEILRKSGDTMVVRYRYGDDCWHLTRIAPDGKVAGKANQVPADVIQPAEHAYKQAKNTVGILKNAGYLSLL